MSTLRNLWSRRWVRATAYGIVSLVTAVLLLFTWVNWQGGREINAALARLKAEGETIDFRAIVPDAVPDQQNFCATPALLDLALAVDNDPEKGQPAERRKAVAKLKLPAERRPKFPSVHTGEHLDLPAFAKYLQSAEGSADKPAENTDASQAARGILQWMAPSEPLLTELATVTGRPHAQWTPSFKKRELPGNLFTVTLPHLGALQSFSTLSLRIAALQQTGQTPEAFDSVMILSRVTEANFNDPLLIGFLVGAATLAHLSTGVWELASVQAGAIQDYEKLEAALHKIDVRASLLTAYRSELAACASSLLYYRDHSAQIAKDFNGAGAAAPGWFSRFSPSGIMESAAARIADLELQYLVKPIKAGEWTGILDSAHALDKEMSTLRSKSMFSAPNQIALLVIPAASNIASRAAYSEVQLGQSLIACALERHRIAHGDYPETLAELRMLNGAAQPLDPFSGKPYGYRKVAGGRFVLYSIGFDRKDDGGQRGAGKEQPNDRNYKGDLVWDYPPKK